MTNPGHLRVEFGPVKAEDAPQQFSKFVGKPTKMIHFYMAYPEAFESSIDDVATVLAMVRLEEKEAARLVGRFFASIISSPEMGVDA
jgi:hypothetical protein